MKEKMDLPLGRSIFILLFLKTVLQTDSAVEDQLAGLGVLVSAEVTHAQELEAVGDADVSQRGLQLGALQNLQRTGCRTDGPRHPER